MEDRQVVEDAVAAMSAGDIEQLMTHFAPDAVADWSNSQAPYRGVYSGRDEMARGWRENLMATFDQMTIEPERIEVVAEGTIVVGSHLHARGRDGIEVDAHGGQLWNLREGRVVRVTLFQGFDEALDAGAGSERVMAAAVRLMGVLNVTPDSFSDGGLFLEPGPAIAHGRELAADGASILDVGGESTRPGAEEVGAEEELRRTEPVVQGLAEALGAGGVSISIDTSKLAVAEAALDAGASIVNDVTALRADPGIAELVADRGAGLVLMHMLGTPRTMQRDPTYGDVVVEVRDFLAERAEAAIAAGVAGERIWIDPGIGFGKTLEHNLELLRRLGEIAALGHPVLVGASRKSFIGKIDGSEAGERLGGTVAASVLAAAGGADVLRVHDVAAMAEAMRVAEAILEPSAP